MRRFEGAEGKRQTSERARKWRTRGCYGDSYTDTGREMDNCATSGKQAYK